ncbi:hypothetical protein HMPREF9946_00925 [Acetobacteraceae bacterium AT-5844]|nr:hypothetical protein HMPREF9946_00925 [Acetobacteraceae bacterium AT-5844]
MGFIVTSHWAAQPWRAGLEQRRSKAAVRGPGVVPRRVSGAIARD